MISSKKCHDRDLITTNGLESRAISSHDVVSDGLESKLKECSLTNTLQNDHKCVVGVVDLNKNEMVSKQERNRMDRPRFNSDYNKPRSFPPGGSRRPVLQKKSFSDLSSYRNVQMKILVEGKEVGNTQLQSDYNFGLCSASQEQATDTNRTLDEQEKTKGPGKLIAGWFSKKTQSKSQCNDKVKEPPIGFRSLKRSKSFTVRIKDKIKSISPTSGMSDAPGSPDKTNGVQSPLFYRTIELQHLNNHEDVKAFRQQYRRRHSDQTDSMSRRTLGSTRYDYAKAQRYYTLNLERIRRKQIPGDKTPLARRKSNSLEAPLEFPFWSQITDSSRSQSCNARIRVSETHRDTDGTLETNLCSTEL